MEWRSIPGFPGYKISVEGGVVSPLGNKLKRFRKKHAEYYSLRDRDGDKRHARVVDLMTAAMNRGRVVPEPKMKEETK